MDSQTFARQYTDWLAGDEIEDASDELMLAAD